MRTFGLIGKKIGHSFSPKYFAHKFATEQIEDASYELFPLATIHDFPALLKQEPNLAGLNVTIPYKTAIIDYLGIISPQAQAVGAVNTIQFADGKLIGHNTDVWGFSQSLNKYIDKQQRQQALVLGTGGAALAVCYALEQLHIPYQLVSRQAKENCICYEDISVATLAAYSIIVNTTPLGMSPNIDSCPTLPYQALEPRHILFDLVYNPVLTLFLQKGKEKGCIIQNGLEMLHLQADKAWAIWTPQ